MSATWSISTQPALFAGQNHVGCMSPAMQTTCMPTPASTRILETGVVTPVSLFALVLALLISLLGALLTLSSLTGLLGLVGLTTGLAPSAAQGD